MWNWKSRKEKFTVEKSLTICTEGMNFYFIPHFFFLLEEATKKMFLFTDKSYGWLHIYIILSGEIETKFCMVPVTYRQRYIQKVPGVCFFWLWKGKNLLTIVSVYSISLSSETSLIFLASLSKSRRKFFNSSASMYPLLSESYSRQI